MFIGSDVKDLLANAEPGSIPGWEDPLEKGMATNSSILAWRIPWTEDPGGLQSVDCKELDITEQLTHLFTATLFTIANQTKRRR